MTILGTVIKVFGEMYMACLTLREYISTVKTLKLLEEKEYLKICFNIKRLEKIKAKYGDKPVLVWTPNSDDLEKSEDCLFVVPEEYQDEADNDS